MSKGIYTGVSGTARRVSKIYVGVGGVARKVKKGYVGVNGTARLFYSAKEPRLPSGYTELDYIYTDHVNTYMDLKTKADKDTTVILDAQIRDIEYSGTFRHGNLINSQYPATNSATLEGAAFNAVYSSNSNYIKTRIGYDASAYGPSLKDTQIASNMTSRFQLTLRTDGTCSINGINFPAVNKPLSTSNFNMSNMTTIKLLESTTAKLYGFQMYSGGTLKMNLVPCKTSTGVVGAYDLIGAKLYQSASTSFPFLPGPIA